jgi:hypothetical protein
MAIGNVTVILGRHVEAKLEKFMDSYSCWDTASLSPAEVETDIMHFTHPQNCPFWARFSASLILLIPLPNFHDAFPSSGTFKNIQGCSRGLLSLLLSMFALSHADLAHALSRFSTPLKSACCCQAEDQE